MPRWYEWECTHNVGHPRKDYLDKYDPDGSKHLGIHGCCGCCIDGDPQGLPTLKRPPIDDEFPYMFLEQIIGYLDED